MQDYIIKGKYVYQIPDVPTDVRKIINWEISDPLEQYWRKPIIPTKFSSAREEEEFWHLQFDRMWNGCWFYNKGVPTYITGAHYEYLTFYKTKDEIKYWDCHKDYAYFDDYVNKQSKIVGKVTLKGRRCGITQFENFFTLRVSKSGRNMQCGLMSMNLQKSIRTMLKPIRDALVKYPKNIRPKFKTGAGNKLIEASINYTSSSIDEDDSYLGGWILPLATTSTAFDGDKLHRLQLDEVFKWEGVDPMDVIEPQLKTMKLIHTGEIIGKASLFSTMGTDMSKMKKAIQFASRIWESSNPDTVDENGRTPSGFLRYFVGIYDYMGIDKYGFVDKEKADKEWQEEIDIKIKQFGEGSKEHIAELKALPRTPEDAFDTPEQYSAFNRTGRVSKWEREILSMPVAERGYVHGKFIEGVNGVVKFDTSSEYIGYGWSIRGLNIEKPNNIKNYGGVFMPNRNPEGCGGYDPFRIDKDDAVSAHLSQAGILLFKKFDHYSKNGIENEIIGQYIGREEDGKYIHEQFALACRYFGFMMSPERNVGVTWFKENGYTQLMTISPYDGKRGILMQTSEQKNVLRDGMELIADYLKEPKEGDRDFLKTIPFPELLAQLKSFTKDQLRSHDLIAAMIQCFIGASKLKDTVIGSSKASNLYNSFFTKS